MNLGDVCLSRFWERLFGLSPLGSLGEKYRGSVFIPNCRSIHTFTLRNPIDLEWVDFDGKLIRRECSVPPRSIRRCPQAYGVRERYSNQRCPSQEGWGATETVLVLPLVLMIFFFAMQLAYIAIAKVHLGHALREGMRAASAALSAPDANSTHGASKARMDSFAGPESAIDNDGQTVVQDAFEDAIFRVLGAWSAFYGEAQGEGIGDIGVGGLGPHLKWVATLQPGYLQPRDLQPRLVQPNGIPSNSSDGAPFGSDAPDHLVGALTLRVPLKMPFFGPSLAQIFSVHEDCRAELEGSMLCLDANRWYWKLRARARIPLPTSLRFEGFVIGKAVSTPEKGVTHAQSKPKDDSSDRSHQEITAVPSVNDKSSRQLPFSVLPQTIAALAEELQAVAPRASERGDAAVADCGIQFGN